MRWFRKRGKPGARLALFVLAMQFTLSFGHFHGLAAQAAPGSVPAPTATAAIGGDTLDVQAAPQDSSSRDHDQRPVDNCAICAVVTLAAAAKISSPPVLLLPQALEFLYLATDAEFLHLKFVGVHSQPRVPPAS